ncbi:hypothetical protein LZ30DRAFT_172151 [Colletotrichum cereale]|nr:hypothetical protein LZ30DRAFT_172151 [Colletotrichum cereale]
MPVPILGVARLHPSETVRQGLHFTSLHVSISLPLLFRVLSTTRTLGIPAILPIPCTTYLCSSWITIVPLSSRCFLSSFIRNFESCADPRIWSSLNLTPDEEARYTLVPIPTNRLPSLRVSGHLAYISCSTNDVSSKPHNGHPLLGGRGHLQPQHALGSRRALLLEGREIRSIRPDSVPRPGPCETPPWSVSPMADSSPALVLSTLALPNQALHDEHSRRSRQIRDHIIPRQANTPGTLPALRPVGSEQRRSLYRSTGLQAARDKDHRSTQNISIFRSSAPSSHGASPISPSTDTSSIDVPSPKNLPLPCQITRNFADPHIGKWYGERQNWHQKGRMKKKRRGGGGGGRTIVRVRKVGRGELVPIEILLA